MSTNTGLGFLDAWRIYSKRWTIEVVFKDCKQHLMLGKCQSTNFVTQVAATSICAIQYNLLSLAKRFMDYETIGSLFREISKETVKQSIAQQLWGKVQEMLTAVAKVYGLVDENLYDIIINRTEQVENMFAAFNLKQAS
ncbi:MAG: transposase [Bacteroidales bacterium]|nr:transposase [Bacteroidales bacterium]